MTMQRRGIITFNRITFQQEIDVKYLSEIFQKRPYRDNDGLGFTKVEIIDNVLEATLLKRTPTSIVDYDPASGEFIERDIFIFEDISFCIDFTNNLIYTFFSSGKLNKIKVALREFLQNNIAYTNLELSPIMLVDDLSDSDFECSIKEIAIRKFVYEQGAYGRYVAKIMDSQVGGKLLEDYSDEIQKVTIDVTSNQFEDFSLTISTNNTLAVKSDEDDFYGIIDTIKKIIK